MNQMKLGPENINWDKEAKYLYNLHRNHWDKPREGWKPFEGLKRQERDYWRALAVTSEGFEE